jgi:pilus assembly protein CpaF
MTLKIMSDDKCATAGASTMFGKRSLHDVQQDQSSIKPIPQNDRSYELVSASTSTSAGRPETLAPTTVPPAASRGSVTTESAARIKTARKTDEYYELKTQVFAALIDSIDVTQLAAMSREQARAAIGEVVNDIVTAKKVVMSISEQDDLLQDICNDVLGYGPFGASPCSGRYR